MTVARSRRAEPLVALFVAVSWAAVVFGASGLMTLILDRDVIEVAAPRFSGILTLLVAGFALWIVVALRARAERVPWPAALAAAAAVYFVFLGSAAVLGFPLLVAQISSPFVVVAALLGGVAVLSTWAVVRRIEAGGGRPRG